ncbi:MAG: prephenate dehydrogenase [Candidatus Omnitrophica bacterium]|nr:prephenate dehydrogenase [Candidatus Omnitrophota bacterium]
MMFNKITIIGLGLIGGSLALAIKEKKLAKEIAGVSRRKSTIDRAIENKIVDFATLNLKDGVKDSDLVIIAAPVLRIAAIAKLAAPFLKKDAILTDAGSTKRYILKYIEKSGFKSVNFVGSHPIAGSEKSGIKSANKDLFEKSCCILTKTKNTNPKTIVKLKKFWRKLGMQVAIMSPQMHDKILSEISHMPHAVSVSLVNSVGKNSLKLAAGGFKDITRIASGEPELWKDIFLTNRDNLVKDIEILKKELSKIQIALKNNDEACLLKLLGNAKVIRDSL